MSYKKCIFISWFKYVYALHFLLVGILKAKVTCLCNVAATEVERANL